jgi:penicillin-binding protein 1A
LRGKDVFLSDKIVWIFMIKLIKFLFWSSISCCLLAVFFILGAYFILRPSLPEISLVDEAQLQMPLKILTEDGILIGEFGEIKRRSLDFQDIPTNIKNAFLAAEDDQFFNHQGISYKGLLRSVIRCLSPNGCYGGGGTISMQVVRGYLLTREVTISRKAKEIFLALQLEGEISKEEIFELYINRNFFGNRSYGIEAASNTYFNKNTFELSLSEAATIAAMAQSPSRINAIKAPKRTEQRRNWILSRMLKLNMISRSDYDNAIKTPLSVVKNIDLYEVDGRYLAEKARQDIISRYGLEAYKNGWSVYTTLNSKLQASANKNSFDELLVYDKRHGWHEAENFAYLFTDNEISFLSDLDINFLQEDIYVSDIYDDSKNLSNQISIIFENFPHYKTHIKGLVISFKDDKLHFIDENLEIHSIVWSDEYEWARKRISNNQRGPKPQFFNEILNFGDFIYLRKEDEFFKLDQIPKAETSLISIHPMSGAVKAYVGGSNFSSSNFDRVALSYPQPGSSFKPFIYAAALANEYNLFSLVNDAPIAFEDKNLESVWRPENYTGKFYGPTSVRDALINSLNIVSIKLLRDVGIDKAQNYLQNFGYKKSRLPSDLSLALGSGNFSPIEMVRAFSVIANGGYLIDPYYISKIEDRNGNIIYSHEDFLNLLDIKEITAFPWLDTLEMNIKKPYFLIEPLFKEDKVIDERIAFLTNDVLKEFMTKGTAGRKAAILNRKDIGGKTGTTNDAVSTWFSGFHEDLATTVWVGTDDFTSLGENEYGSTIALPIWINYMQDALENLEVKERNIPEGISFVKVNKETGEIDNSLDAQTYFELILDENLED